MIDERRLISIINIWKNDLEKPRKRLNGNNLLSEKINVDGEGYFEGQRAGFNLVLAFIGGEVEQNNVLQNSH